MPAVALRPQPLPANWLGKRRPFPRALIESSHAVQPALNQHILCDPHGRDGKGLDFGHKK